MLGNTHCRKKAEKILDKQFGKLLSTPMNSVLKSPEHRQIPA